MVFNSLTFVMFFALVLCMHAMPFSWRTKKTNLLMASYLFYAAWNPPFIILLWVSTIVDWYAAQKLVHAEKPRARKLWMLLSVVVNLGMLAYFKYGTFMLTNFTLLASSLGIDYQPPTFDIILPVGISFYTFATLSYTLDIYLKRAEPAKSFLDYALFVTFFPHLVAGPIMRPTELVPQFETARAATRASLSFGLGLMILGMFQKIVLADGFLGPTAESIFDSTLAPGFIDAWLGTLAFSGQIFCDFAGYSTTAIGAAMCLGFAMPDNFRFPYAAIGFSDFWRRWHITLSAWLRDYLYIPLGGNRCGEFRTYIALMTTMLLGGLWHGANWTFVVWGGLHGLYLTIERLLKRRFSSFTPSSAQLFALGVLTYALVNLTWVFFRSSTFERAWSILRGMLGLNSAAAPILTTAQIVMPGVIVSGILICHAVMRDLTLESTIVRVPSWAIAMSLGIMLFALIITQGTGSAFIYFQF